MIRNFEIDMIGRDDLFPRPAIINNLCQFVRDVQTPAIFPAVVKPFLQLLAGVVIQYVYIKFTLLAQSRQG